jgi:hypothetical protein
VSRTRNLRRQHDAAVALVEKIVAATLNYAGREDAVKISLLLAKLHGSLRIHFAQEDCSLYPFMMDSAHPEAGATAEAFQSEMGNLASTFRDFAQGWSAADAIAADLSTFRRQSEQVFGALLTRIERENIFSILWQKRSAEIRFSDLLELRRHHISRKERCGLCDARRCQAPSTAECHLCGTGMSG